LHHSLSSLRLPTFRQRTVSSTPCCRIHLPPTHDLDFRHNLIIPHYLTAFLLLLLFFILFLLFVYFSGGGQYFQHHAGFMTPSTSQSGLLTQPNHLRRHNGINFSTFPHHPHMRWQRLPSST